MYRVVYQLITIDMKTNSLKIRFILYKSRRTINGNAPIHCRITYNKMRKSFATGLSTNQKDWNSKSQRSEQDEIINQNLEVIKRKLEEIELYLKIKNDDFGVDSILEMFHNKPKENSRTLISFYKEFLDRQKALIGKDLKQVTWNKYSYIYDHLEEFLKKNSISKLKLKDLKLKLLFDFEHFLKTEKNNKQITVNKTIQRFRKVIKQAQIDGIIDNDPFLGYKVKKVRNEIVYLKKEELKTLENKSFASNRLSKVRDCFVLCCYTGLAYNEMSNLKTKHIQTDSGIKWIVIKRTKTQKILEIPLLAKAEAIISCYTNEEGLQLPIVSNQRFNSYLKEISAIVGIDKRLTHHVARKTFATTVLLENKIPIEIVSHVLGHSNVKVTQDHYGKILSGNVAKAFKSLNKKI